MGAVLADPTDWGRLGPQVEVCVCVDVGVPFWRRGKGGRKGCADAVGHFSGGCGAVGGPSTHFLPFLLRMWACSRSWWPEMVSVLRHPSAPRPRPREGDTKWEGPGSRSPPSD